MVITRLHLKQWDFNIKYYKAALLLGSYVLKASMKPERCFQASIKQWRAFLPSHLEGNELNSPKSC